MKTKTKRSKNANREGRTVNGQWLDAPVTVETTLHSAIDHLITGLQEEWTEGRDSATTDNFQHMQFRAKTIAGMFAVLMSEMESRARGVEVA